MTQKNKEIEIDENFSVPEKFKNEATGEINVEALLKSYLALEKKLGQKGVSGTMPASPEEYKIEITSPLMKNDMEINRRLFELGLTNEQVQAIYDLAAEKVIPVILNLSETVQANKALSELEQAFGGAEQFNIIARQISAWGEKNLSPSVFETLASSKDGIVALYKMMCSEQEASVLPREDSAQPTDSEETLKRLMQSPKYWKQQDPELMRRVENGFKRLYG